MAHGGVEGVLLLLEAFGWLYEPRDKVNPLGGGQRLLPWVIWPYQEDTIRAIYHAITEGEDLLIDKSRDMGATWMVMAVFWAFWMFQPESTFSVMSRKEEYVDKTDNPKTLFWKLDWLNQWLPSWMRPKTRRGNMILVNEDNGSVIEGESSNADAGRGGRGGALFVDEAGSVENLLEVMSATADETPCRIFGSTPKGMGMFDATGDLIGNCFAAKRFSGTAKVVSLHWPLHPHKGKGKRPIIKANGKIGWTSPWYEAECSRRASKKEIAQELDLDYLGSGDMFFDSDVLAVIRSQQIMPPIHCGSITYDTETIIDAKRYRIVRPRFEHADGGNVSIYRKLIEDDLYKERLAQDATFAAFADIGLGTGASNSVFEVFDALTGEQVLEYATPYASPERFARDCVALLQWIGGQMPCLFGWEANGPGEMFGREVHRFGWRAVHGNTDTSLPWEPGDSKIGWYSDRPKKLRLFGDYRAALARGETLVRSEAAVGELELCVNYPSGGVGPSHLVTEAEGARAAHGDRNVALCGAWMVCKEQPKYRFVEPEPDPDSIDGRIARRDARDRMLAAEKGKRW